MDQLSGLPAYLKTRTNVSSKLTKESSMARNIAQNYRKAQLNTASPGQRVVLMYEGLLKELLKAKKVHSKY